LIVNVFPCEYPVPEPFAAVFHPPKLYPVLANTGNPEFPKTVTVESAEYGEELSIGTFPLVFKLPLYVTVYILGPLGVPPAPVAELDLAQLYALRWIDKPDLLFDTIYYIYYKYLIKYEIISDAL
jgi:hypothetical protein